MTYPMAGGPGPGVYPPPQGQTPWTPPTAPPPRPPRRTATRLALAAAILAAGLGGGITGALLTRADTSATSPTTTPAVPARETSTPEYVRSQDVKLCTEYVLMTAALTNPTVAGELAPAAAAVRTSLAAHPDASADVRSALSDVVDAYFAELSSFESRGPKGLVDPPKYDQAAARDTYDRAWAICGLK